MPRQMPTCKKCGAKHWNMAGCPEPDTSDRQPPVLWGKSMSGFRPFGNVAGGGMEHLGNSANTVVRRG